jgi:hypothetical protein
MIASIPWLQSDLNFFMNGIFYVLRLFPNTLTFPPFQRNYLVLLYTSPATVKVLETFLEAILWKGFLLFRRFLNDVSSNTKNAVTSVPISFDGRGKNHLGSGQESMGDASILLLFSLVRNPWLQPTGVLEHCRERETNCWFIYSSVAL